MREVEEMHALVNELPSTGPRRIGPPLAIITRAAAVAVMRSQVHEVAVRAGPHLLRDANDRRMEAVVETDLHPPSCSLRSRPQPIDVVSAEPRRLLDEDVRAAFQRGRSQL